MSTGEHAYNETYTGDHLNRIAFPLGGIGAGMMCLEGSGALSHVSLRHRPDVFNEPRQFAALHVGGDTPTTRVLEGPVPMWKAFGQPGAGNGSGATSYGLPRFRQAAFTARFPFATISLRDPSTFVEVELTGWSPVVPGPAAPPSLPTRAPEYTLNNPAAHPLPVSARRHISL